MTKPQITTSSPPILDDRKPPQFPTWDLHRDWHLTQLPGSSSNGK